MIYLFNPDHDMALANGKTNYMPPESARQMAADLALLPLWYALPRAQVLAAPDCHLADFLNRLQLRLNISASLVGMREVVQSERPVFCPWGWNPSLRRKLEQQGISRRFLPSDAYMETLRRFSHRRFAVELLPKLRTSRFFCGESAYLQTVDECRAFVESRTQSLLKAPLSGSGKGLCWCNGRFTPSVSGWCRRVIASQGGVAGEPVYEKVLDFALEFHSGNGEIRFLGYSIFCTTPNGKYAGNELGSNEEMARRLSSLVPLGELLALQSRLENELQCIARFYNGFLGVDMMVCHFPGHVPEYRIHPCVEVNLRTNMGVVARLLSDNYLVPGAHGIFRISHHPDNRTLLAAHRQLSQQFPLSTRNGKVRSGYLPLVPVTPASQYHAFAVVTPRDVPVLP